MPVPVGDGAENALGSASGVAGFDGIADVVLPAPFVASTAKVCVCPLGRPANVQLVAVAGLGTQVCPPGWAVTT